MYKVDSCVLFRRDSRCGYYSDATGAADGTPVQAALDLSVGLLGRSKHMVSGVHDRAVSIPCTEFWLIWQVGGAAITRPTTTYSRSRAQVSITARCWGRRAPRQLPPNDLVAPVLADKLC